MAPLKSWLEIDVASPFSVHNIPFEIISTPANSQPHHAIAIGSCALDLVEFTNGNGWSALSIN